jgi:hypothetical protein
MFQLTIHGFGAENYIVDIDIEDEEEFNKMTILELKNIFLNQTALPVNSDTLRFLFAGKQLENEKIFKDYGIKDKSKIMIVVRLPGGLKMTWSY